MRGLKTFFSVLFYSLQAAVTTIVLDNGYGRGDLSAFLLWTIPFCLLMIPIGKALRTISGSWRFQSRLTVFLFVPFFSGLLWGFLVLKFLGFWFGLFSFPVTLCWMAAGLVALASWEMVNHFHPRVLGRTAILLGSLLICGAIPPTISKAFIYLSGEQTLDVSLFRWFPGPEPFSGVEERDLVNLSDSDIIAIRKAGITGRVLGDGGGKRGNGPEARLLFFVRTMPDREISLPLPDRCFMIYYEVAPNQFERWPKNAKVRKEQIRIIPARLDKDVGPDLRRANEINFVTADSRFNLPFDYPKDRGR